MADAEAPEAPSRSTGKGIGARLTRKLGPLPVWAWALGVGGLAFLGYRYWASKNAAASSSTAATAVGAGTTATGAPTDTSGGGGYSDGGGGQLATLLQTLQTQLGNGGAGTGSQPGYSLLSSQAAIQAVRSAGQTLYEQLTPGVFTQYTGGVPTQAAINAGQTTPLYALTNGVAASSTGASTSAGVSGAAAPTTTTSPAAATAVTTPAPTVAPVTSGPTATSGGSLGGVAQVGGIGSTAPAVGGAPLPASGPLV
jgi:mucin-19